MRRQFLALLKALGITTPDEQVAAALDAAGITDEAPAPTPPAPAASAPDLSQQIAAALAPLQQQVQGLTAALEAEKSARATAQQALEAQQAADRAGQVTATLDEAIKAGRLEAAKRSAWQARLEKDFDTAKAILDEMPSATAPKSTSATPAAPPAPASSSLRPDVSSYLATALASNPTAATA